MYFAKYLLHDSPNVFLQSICYMIPNVICNYLLHDLQIHNTCTKKAQVTLSNFVCVKLMHIVHIHSLKFEGSMYIYIYIYIYLPYYHLKDKLEVNVK
jgi:hypothetical protein